MKRRDFVKSLGAVAACAGIPFVVSSVGHKTPAVYGGNLIDDPIGKREWRRKVTLILKVGKLNETT